MDASQLRSSVGLLSALVFGAALSVAGCGDDSGGGGSGGRTVDAAMGTGGKATGGSGGGGATADAGRDGATATGGAGGAGGVDGAAGTGGTRVDAPDDVPAGTGGTGAVDGGGIDGAGGAIDTRGVDGAAALSLHLYVGCADSTGTIQTYALNSGTAALAPLTTFTAGGAISNSEFNDSGDRFYVAHMIGSEANLTTYARNAATGGLTAMGSPVPVPYNPPTSGGVDGGGVDGGGVDGGGVIDAGVPPTNAGPQTLTFDRNRHFVAVPNYYSGYVYIYGMATDGTIGSLVSSHTAGNNAHHAVFTLNNHFMIVPYLGSNLIQVYAFNDSTGALTPAGSTTLPAAGSGPRHVTLHANGKWLYSINETAGGGASASGTIDFFTVDQSAGTVTSSATFAVPLPAGYTGVKNGGEIEIAPSGNLLFVSMRLDNIAQGSLVAYRIDSTTGALTLIEQESSQGLTPRQFSLSKDGQLLVVGNQNSNTIALFQVDPATGGLTFVSTQAVCTSPRFAKMATVK